MQIKIGMHVVIFNYVIKICYNIYITCIDYLFMHGVQIFDPFTLTGYVCSGTRQYLVRSPHGNGRTRARS